MNMKVKYKAPKRNRINTQFIGFTTFEDGWWFNKTTNRWELNPKIGKDGLSSHQMCGSVRAFRRNLKKAPKGVKFTLSSRWRGHEVEGTGSKS